MFFFRGPGNKYINRGDPSAYDFTEAGLTFDGAFHDLDLSSIVPAGAIAVYLRCYMTANAANKNFCFRKKGNSNAIVMLDQRTQVANITISLKGFVACDTNRVIQYTGDAATWANCKITVMGWIK